MDDGVVDGVVVAVLVTDDVAVLEGVVDCEVVGVLILQSTKLPSSCASIARFSKPVTVAQSADANVNPKISQVACTVAPCFSR